MYLGGGKMKRYVAMIVCLFMCHMNARNIWTWSYNKYFVHNQDLGKRYNREILFSKINIEHFSQLIFSWNALRPKKGYFRFYVKTRNASDKKWSKWHKMIDWGDKIQKTYFSKDEHSKYVYVRLEKDLDNLADAFCVRVEKKEGVNLNLLKSMTVSISDFNKFKPEFIGNNLLSLKSICIKNVPKISQRVLDHPHTSRICSPTSCSIVASFFNKKMMNAVAFSYLVFDNSCLQAYGSWPFNTSALYSVCDQKIFCATERMNSFSDIHKKLLLGVPVIVSVRGRLDGALKPYNGGHFMVVIGWDKKNKKVICHDPAFYSDESTFVKYGISTFVRAWEKSRRLAYVVKRI